mmetsp:Transcript_31969/g.72958  ORF Transcript_31969/g.72958 Transcript_31969/m.72958 type:complete len:337 (+) Transcript_31969:133-1143(+)
MGRNNTRAARRAAAAVATNPIKQAVICEPPEEDIEAETSTATPSSGTEDVENLSTSSPASNAEEDAESPYSPEIVIAEDIQESLQTWDTVEVAKPHESVVLRSSVEAEILTVTPANEEDADEMSTCPPSSKVEETVDDVESSTAPSVSEKLPEEASARIATEFIVDLQPQSNKTQADQRLQKLCSEVTNLSQDSFGEDACKAVSGHSSWRLTVLVGSADPEADPEGHVLVGFVLYRFRTDPKFRCLSIAKIAVHPDHRRHGFGSTVLAWCIARAKAQREITSVKLCALAEVVHWYRKRGFKREMKLEDDEDHVPGQVAMAKYLPIRGAPLGKARRR